MSLASLSRKCWVCFFVLFLLQILSLNTSAADGAYSVVPDYFDSGEDLSDLNGRLNLSPTDNSASSSLPQVDLSTGKLNYSIPIKVPPGRNGMQPNLALTYKSGRENSWVGVGWDLSVGAIQRNTKHGVDYSENDFLFNGIELVEVEPGEYQAKFENEFNRITQQTASDGQIYWEVTDKTGKRFLFGQVVEARQDDPADANRIFKWCLDKVADTHGNYITYSYSKNQGQIYLDQIEYTGNGSLAPAHKVKFYLEDRDDAPRMYTTGPMVKTTKRLASIEVLEIVDDSLVSKYLLSYVQSTNTSRSLLDSVRQYGSDGISSLPPIALGWQAGNMSWVNQPSLDTFSPSYGFTNQNIYRWSSTISATD